MCRKCFWRSNSRLLCKAGEPGHFFSLFCGSPDLYPLSGGGEELVPRVGHGAGGPRPAFEPEEHDVLVLLWGCGPCEGAGGVPSVGGCGDAGNALHTEYAPYLDYRPLAEDEPGYETVLGRPECDWIGSGLE